MQVIFTVKMQELRRGEELGGKPNTADRFRALPLCKMVLQVPVRCRNSWGV